jgi:3-phosphoshikimate 1-carboxyvinyltransferase
MPARPEFLDLVPVARAAGTVRLPGSKSVSNRALLLAALAAGEIELEGVLRSDDTQRMLDALQTLGIGLKQDGGRVWLSGCNLEIPVKDADLFLGNAGTAFRPLTAALALSRGHYRLSGVPRMHERPIGDLVDALRELGADVRYLGNSGFPPLEIFPAAANKQQTQVRGDVSSQFLTALLMALPVAGGGSVAIEGELISKPYVEITLELMRRFGVEVERHGWTSFRVPAGARYRSPASYRIEGDASSASYFLAAGAAGGPVRVEGVGRGSIQGDVRFIEALAAMGAHIESGTDWIEANAPPAARLRAYDGDCNAIPDAAMTLAVLALFADGTTHLRNIASWRVKETDRIAAMAKELRKLGAMVEEGEDNLKITPPQAITPNVAIDTYDDHRMAMCFSLVCLAGVPVRIKDPECVAKTFPDYFERFAEVCRAQVQ